MPIAIIAWGSLIWSPEPLALRSRWYSDGPLLPVEFARISNGDRLTLVIHPSSESQPTYWAAAASDELERVRENLRQREETRIDLIHFGTASGVFSEGVAESLQQAMRAWLKQQPHLSGCVWTGLSSNWRDVQTYEFSADAAVRYLSGLKDPAAARDYVQKTPPQIQTQVRAALRARLGWRDTELPGILFENAYSAITEESRNP